MFLFEMLQWLVAMLLLSAYELDNDDDDELTLRFLVGYREGLKSIGGSML